MVLSYNVTEKSIPTYALESFKAAISSAGDLTECITFTAMKTAIELGFGPVEVLATIRAMEHRHFYKSMPSLGNAAVRQDVYHVPYGGFVIYIKFRADIVTEFQLLSFKEK